MRYKNRLMRVDEVLSRQLAKAEDKESEWLELLSRDEQDKLLAVMKEFERSQTPETMERASTLRKTLYAAAFRRQGASK